MGRFHLLLALVSTAAITVGCGHAKTVGPAVPPAEAKKAEASKEADAKPDEAPKEKKTTTTATFTSHHATSSDDAKEKDGAVRLSTSPTALLKPGALEHIQEKLAHEGDLKGEPSGKMDAETTKALTEFQRHKNLPATGIPDDATVSRLGLKPSEVFRSGTTP